MGVGGLYLFMTHRAMLGTLQLKWLMARKTRLILVKGQVTLTNISTAEVRIRPQSIFK